LIELILPWPPSANNYIRHAGKFHYKTPAAKAFIKGVADEVLMKRSAKRLTSRLNVAIDLHQPDKRKVDIDNRIKPLLDALQSASVYLDDEQIDSLAVTRCKAIKGGCVRVTIEEVGA
jgi:crossover junction endodeoxyribonuclease RusA